MRILICTVFCFLSVHLRAQIPTLQRQDNFPVGNTRGNVNRGQGNVSNNKVADFERPPITEYKIISIAKDTTLVDTSLSIQKEYKFNYLRRDRYGLLPFANSGQGFNTLVKEFKVSRGSPAHMAQGRHFNYLDATDIFYYHVPTPLTELYYRTAFEQGQQLDAFFTVNTSKQFNLFIGYKGLRSLGKYQNSLTSTGNFRTGFSYNTKNRRYHIKAHWAAQDLLNNENGGLSATGLENFESEDSEFDDRSLVEVNFENADNILRGIRLYANQYYDIIRKKDSVRDVTLRVGHVINSENKFYRFTQDAAVTSIFGEAFDSTTFSDRADLEEVTNELNLTYKTKHLGAITFQTNWTHFDYGYNSVLIREDDNGQEERIPNKRIGDVFAAGARYKNKLGPVDFQGEVQANIAGDFDGFFSKVEAGYTIKKDSLGNGPRWSASLEVSDHPAAYNHLLNQSNYINYNWFNQDSYKNISTTTLGSALTAPRLVNLSASYSVIDNWVYFGEEPLAMPALGGPATRVISLQSTSTINHLKITAQRSFKVGKFALDAALTYQNVSGEQDIINVPNIYTRSSLYFTDRLFKGALFLQTGFNATYFTSYNMDGYDPVLAEFYTQNTEEIGGFPLLDFFINFKVRQTRIFFKAEHFNSSLSEPNFFSAPGYPYRDFNIRFGLVWNFFL